MTLRHRFRLTLTAAALAGLLCLGAHPALAQDRGNGNFLDNLFNRGQGTAQDDDRQGRGAGGGAPIAQADPNDPAELTVRLDRIEGALRRLTGTVEQLQYRNQQLEAQISRMQGAPVQGPGQVPIAAPNTAPNLAPNAAPMLPPSTAPGQGPGTGPRSDAFDPSRQPQAPGAPRTLGSVVVNSSGGADDQPVGAPGGRAAGTPLDLSTLSASPVPVSGPGTAPPPVVTPAVPNAPAGRLATLPPTATPQDQYDLAYGYVLHKDYALAEQAFRDFIKKYPDERLQPDAQYWLGESLYQRQRYRDAAESFLAVSTKYDKAGKAPDALLRLGQSLAAMKQKEAACATLGEVERKYPKASSAVKRGVAAEIKRAHC